MSGGGGGEGRRVIIAPSVLASDLSRLAEEAADVMRCGGDWVHLDVMDGHFLENLTFGPPTVSSLRSHSTAFFDVHMMVSNPLQWVTPFVAAGADQLTFHWEATDDPQGVAQAILVAGKKAGVALKPATPVQNVFPLLETGTISTLLIMTVQPGFGGQKFMGDMMSKVADAHSRFPNLDIQVDGGLNQETARIAARHGANIIVAGTSIFKAQDRAAAIREMREGVTLELRTFVKDSSN